MNFFAKQKHDFTKALEMHRENGSIPIIFYEEELQSGLTFFRYNEIGTIIHDRKKEKIVFWSIILAWVLVLASLSAPLQFLIYEALFVLFITLLYYILRKAEYLYVIDNTDPKQKKKKLWVGLRRKTAEKLISRIRQEMFERGYPSPKVVKINI